MPLRPARVGRVGVIGHPVAKTAVVAKAVITGPLARGEDRRRRCGRHTRPGPQADLARKGSTHLTHPLSRGPATPRGRGGRPP